MKYSEIAYRITTALFIISFIIGGAVVRAMLGDLPSSTFKTIILVILLLPVISFALVLYDRHKAYREYQDHQYDEVIRFSNSGNSEYSGFIQNFRMFTRDHYISDPTLFVCKCIISGMDKYTSVSHTDPGFPRNLRSFDPYYSTLESDTDVMKYNGMKARIEYNSNRDSFIGSILDVGGLMHFTGSSISELHREFEAQVNGYYEYQSKLYNELESERNHNPSTP